MKRETYDRQVKLALEMYEKAGIVLTESEKNSVEVVDWGLDEVETNGLQIITYINTDSTLQIAVPKHYKRNYTTACA